MNPSNIYFENPNDTQTTYPMSVPAEQTNESPKSDTKKDNIKPDANDVLKFLNTKVSTILSFSIAVAIGFALKDFMNALVVNILQPSIMLLIMYFDSNNYLSITQTIREKQVSIDIAKFFGNMLVLKLIIGSMYFINKYSIILF